ncbi:hypothetical protein [Corynebacterium liangguodongii]|uniref:Uncharacterized protein n=1 Tax=Corynebacterium liangguodongii TaxID=2079535 RepID=A0A2S0WEV7_9CORY|nr:hypothetical protein [Corynebacterium liangguodongii]AWB84192.1 hypothetical protein C3E79_06640 [Corynebacterium liangguodongii]PWC00202.1 hypothetical protein DF219_03275 [Corynebacterium liangguodongii]
MSQEEKRTVELGDARWVLIGVIVVYLVALFLPFAGGASGWQVLAMTDASDQAQVTLTEFLFVLLSFIGVAVLSTLTLITRRFAVAALGWMFTTVSLFGSVLALWLRRTSVAYDMGLHHGPGIYLAILAVAVAVFTYIPVVLRRGEEQDEGHVERDEVALAQEAATRASVSEENPLLIDDRRARAAERHKKYRES